jgi:phosphoserine phosphatase RsbU/P
MASADLTAGDVLSAFHRDAPYLFVGAAFVAVGVVSAGFSAVRRRYDRLLLYFALFAVLYGLRLWIQSRLLDLSMHGSLYYPRLQSGIDFLVPIPAFLFFDAAGLLNRWARMAAYGLIVATTLLALATFILGPSASYHLINNVLVIAAIIALAVQSMRHSRADADFAAIRVGLFAFIVFVLWDNVGGLLSLSVPRMEPIGFVAFLGSLGYVAARRTLTRDQQLRDIQKELEVARDIQLSILPADFPGSLHFRVAARYVPMTSVAGDFYDYVVADQRQAGLLIADVSGHGVPAALIASMVKLAAASQRANAADPSVFLSRMNAALCGNTQSQFVTAAYVHLDSAARELRYSAAAHPPMLLLRSGQVSEIEENGLMLAAFPWATYSNSTHRLEEGDRLLLYTDGIIEASNAAGEFFGRDALCNVLRKTAGSTARDAADLIVAAVQKWSATQEDDLTVLVCDYVGDGAALSSKP